MQRIKALATVTLFALLILALAGCSANSVTTIEEKSQPTNDENRRFQNLDSGEKNYPLTCKQDCYKPRSDIQCGSDGLCQYTGNKKAFHGGTDFSVKWLGHAAFVIKTSTGETVLTDPVFNDFDWPINWLFLLDGGEDREMNVEPDPELIAATDAVLYSHLHYDHFNKSDIETIGPKPEYLVPLNVGDHFPSIGATVMQAGGWETYRLIRH